MVGPEVEDPQIKLLFLYEDLVLASILWAVAISCWIPEFDSAILARNCRAVRNNLRAPALSLEFSFRSAVYAARTFFRLDSRLYRI